jgi:transcriptional regulator with XRE-family HTH domain
MLLELNMFTDGALQSLGMNLYTLRHVAGMSLDELSEKLDMPRSIIEEAELGLYPDKTHIDLDVIFKIIRFFNAKIEMNVFETSF